MLCEQYLRTYAACYARTLRNNPIGTDQQSDHQLSDVHTPVARLNPNDIDLLLRESQG